MRIAGKQPLYLYEAVVKSLVVAILVISELSRCKLFEDWRSSPSRGTKTLSDLIIPINLAKGNQNIMKKYIFFKTIKAIQRLL